MSPQPGDPIAAIVTAAGRGAVGIVRVSGTNLAPLILALCGRPLVPRYATYLPFLDASGNPIDHGLAIHFPAPHSYTGEDVLELHGHGGMVVLQLLLQRCLQAGAGQHLRLAQPGEFTQRAFLNDKMDLAQAEAIADLIDASTEAAVRSANRSLSGAFSAEIQALLQTLTDLRMLVEASLDFPEEDIDILHAADVQGRLTALAAILARIRQQSRQGALLRDGMRIVIAGQPNAGKSSLLNTLAGAELAIVSPIAGTTRDKVQQTVQIEGVPVHVIDTAGLRDSTDTIEQMGVARAWAEIETADAVLFLHDGARLFPSDPGVPAAQDDALACREADTVIARTLRQRVPAQVPVIDVWNKSDVMGPTPDTDMAHGIRLSARTGDGLDQLRATLLKAAGWQPVAEGSFMARQRHLQALERVSAHVDAALAHLASGAPLLDLLAEELRLAQNALAEITGAFGADDLLGAIFSRFCIGK
ncbi:MAG: tRNA uridine-5-carboxymethylaminomethyl(34) synthesis GTPase MnmE [Rhodoferax sp.]|jgi:tRNA modification GTPase|nr:tRNA uridine-5-carboxymethylaminomethyl(34) synthesis GTPase MnmE [Rhodoferax sp.]